MRLTPPTAFETVVERVGFAGVAIGALLAVLSVGFFVVEETGGTLILDLPWSPWAKALAWLLAVGCSFRNEYRK